ncbi:MAG: guanylate kinase [Anaerolineae bacterium]
MSNETCQAMQPSDAVALIERFLRPRPVFVIISGPSGVGKDSVIKRMAELGQPLHFVVTATSRQPRAGEVEGVDYCFVSTSDFEGMVAREEMFEHAIVYGQYKGVPKAQAREALASGKDVVMRLDIQGARRVRQIIPHAISIFLVPPSVEVLWRRLQRRAGDTEEQVQERLRTALEELGCIEEFTYAVVNREGALDETVRQIIGIINAEKSRTDRPPVEF